MKHIIKLLAVFTTCTLATTSIYAGNLSFDGSWKEQKFPLVSDNDYAQNGARLNINAQSSVSILFKSVPQSNWLNHSAKWSWTVDQSVPPTDLSLKGGDDRNIALYFIFAPKEVADTLQGAGISKVLRHPQTRALVYIHGGSQNRGVSFNSPYLDGRGVSVVLRSASTGTSSESVNLAADYKRFYGTNAGALFGVGISADSDDTKSSISASISGLQLN